MTGYQLIALLSKAIVSLYISVAFFTLSGLMRSLLTFITYYSLFFKTTIVIGILTLFIGITILIIYAVKALRIRKKQFDLIFNPDNNK